MDFGNTNPKTRCQASQIRVVMLLFGMAHICSMSIDFANCLNANIVGTDSCEFGSVLSTNECSSSESPSPLSASPAMPFSIGIISSGRIQKEPAALILSPNSLEKMCTKADILCCFGGEDLWKG
ncbi:unnamed protein product [Cuscuta epithymum]|uniref:Uncharacterized protein n=1 Tax=Cuscuta epithymum TaxID=186058 RepID=A0AAV0CPV5_9ASTE|nr:unnamed protein product [Cuscuta epithymum]CAH9148922.1 unnamed protein product [Cuscuta epithymum]